MGAWVSSWITVVFSFGFRFSAFLGRARAGRLEAKKEKRKSCGMCEVAIDRRGLKRGRTITTFDSPLIVEMVQPRSMRTNSHSYYNLAKILLLIDLQN